MRKMMKKLVTLGAAAGLTAVFSFNAFAGTWQHLEGGEDWQWKYVEEDGSYTTNGWQSIDGKWYHFDADGYLDVGYRKIDGIEYFIDTTGELMVNKDYGFGYIDENGVWQLKEPYYSSEMEYIEANNLAAQACKEYGVDIDKIIEDCFWAHEYTYSCSSEKFPKYSNGDAMSMIVDKAIVEAIHYYVIDRGITSDYSYYRHYDRASGTYTIKFTSGISSIIGA